MGLPRYEGIDSLGMNLATFQGAVNYIIQYGTDPQILEYITYLLTLIELYKQQLIDHSPYYLIMDIYLVQSPTKIYP